jgi:probable rRNA maturation factor
MNQMAINFYTEDLEYNLKQKTRIRSWLYNTIEAEGYVLEEISFIFCTDEYLLQMNQQYLNHDTYTDVITFDNSGQPKTILGDVFISIDRVHENAKAFRSTVWDELCRVMVHGTLHLLGYKDKSDEDQALMTQKENHYLYRLKGN